MYISINLLILIAWVGKNAEKMSYDLYKLRRINIGSIIGYVFYTFDKYI